MNKKVKIQILKEEICVTFPTEEEREEYARQLEDFLTNEGRLLGVNQNGKMYYLRLYVVNNAEIGAAFRLLHTLGYVTEE